MSTSHNTFPQQYSPSYGYPEQTIDLKLFMDAVFWREDAGATVTMLNGDLVLFSEFRFLLQ